MQMISKLIPTILAIGLLFTWHAARAESPAPRLLGRFGAWSAARYARNGHLLCYAFTPTAAAKTKRPPAMLTVLKSRGGRTDVILSPGFALPRGATLSVSTGSRALAFSAYGRDAFARNRTMTIRAFQRGATAVARTPGPRHRQILQKFSLRGFSAAYAAMIKACA